MAPEDLERILALVEGRHRTDARIIAGHAHHEDAAVVRIPPGKALVQTVDVLAPLVNDPYRFGQIAAANALSDVYAMGGEPWCAMNVACFPSCGMEADLLAAVLSGGLDKIYEAHAVLAGGHTVADDNLKYGLSVTGIIDADCVATNDGLVTGDQLLLTKPLGTGVLATAIKAHREGHEEFEEHIYHYAAALNKAGGALIHAMRLRAATDITGFGLGGHLQEMALASRKCIQVNCTALPLLPHAEELAREGLIPTGSHNNRRFCLPFTLRGATVSDALEALVFDAQTSGGLVLAVPEKNLAEALNRLADMDQQAWLIGAVLPARDDGIRLILE